MTTTATSACKASKAFYTVVGIYDAKTQIRVGSIADKCVTRSSAYAESKAKGRAFIFAEDELYKPWMCKKYGITASQFEAMLQDGVIDPLESFTFKVEKQRILNPKG
jgi:hypothetical protein